MEIIGRVVLVLPEQSGTSKAGNPWKKREYVLETKESYPRKIHFDFFGDRAEQYPLQAGQDIKLYFDIESREFNGRWYTSIRGWKAEPADAQPQAAMPQPAPGFQAAPAAPGAFPPPAAGAAPYPGNVPPPPIPAQEPTDDLPF